MTTTIPIVDGHNDTLLRLYLNKDADAPTFFDERETGHLDLPRAKKGGLGGGFFAIFTPSENFTLTAVPDAIKEDGSYEFPLPPAPGVARAQEATLAMAARLFQIEAEADGQVKVVRTTAELARCLQDDVFAMIFHIEGAEAIDTNLDALYVLYQAGLRSIGPVWSRSNAFGHGVPFKFPGTPDMGPGLTDAGKALVRACNQLGILVDLSHLNEKGFWDVAEISDAPLVATHSGVYALCASTRNLTEQQLDAIEETDGIVGINFHVGFLRKDGQNDANTSLTEIADHLDYVVNRIGIDHVALGSDFDGATMPQDLKDVAGLPKLVQVLRDRGYDDAALRKIAFDNWLRVLEKTWH